MNANQGGFKRHIKDFKEDKPIGAIVTHVKPYAERKAERLRLYVV
jgi:hypothetical protein